MIWKQWAALHRSLIAGSAAALIALAVSTQFSPAAAADDPRVDELERKVDVLIDEIESLKLGAVADTGSLRSRLGFGPAASKVYETRHGVSIGGYGEMLLEKFDRTRENGALSGKTTQLDFLRNIFYIGYKFSDQLIFNSEIEIEHAGILGSGSTSVDTTTGRGSTSLSGEVVLEFAYIDWILRPDFGLRAGMMLLPLGLVNELHEPTTFIGARRPEVERRIIPSTWRGNGAGVFGEFESGIAYRAYVIEGLDASRFNATGGVRDGRQKGSKSRITHPALAVRIDYTARPGLLIGGSLFSGNAWQGPQPAGGNISPLVTILDIHARGQWRGLTASALYANGRLDDAGPLSDALGLTGAKRLGDRFFGYYIDATYDLMQALAPGSPYQLSPYARYERFDTQDDVPGGTEDPAAEREFWTLGTSFRPHPNVVVKLDRQLLSNEAQTETDQWNASLGFVF